MKGILLLVAAATSTISAIAQSPSWQWASSAINRGSVTDNKICLDASGNTYSIGAFTSTIQFPDTTYDANSSSGMKCMYLAKYDKDGVYQWARLFARTNYSTPIAIAADGAGNVYIGGSFGSSGNNTGTIQLPDTTLATTGYQDAFLIKYDHAGRYQWARIYGGSLNEVITTVSIDSRDNVIIGGYFDDSVFVIDRHVLSHPNINGNYGGEFFIAKYDALGSVIWANQGRGVSDYVFNSAVDRSGNIYLAGGFRYRTTFDGIQVQSISSGFVVADNFVAKYDSTGKAIWARVIGGSGGSGHNGGSVSVDLLAVDTAGNAYIGGSHDLSSVLFERTSIPGIAASAGKYWYSKYSSSGQILWANATDASIGSMVWDEPGNLYIVGAYQGDVMLDTILLHGLGGNPGFAFIAKCSSDNSISWIQSIGSVGDAGIGFSGVVIKKVDEPFVTGSIYRGGYVKLGTITVNNYNSPGVNAFIAKMGPSSAVVQYLTSTKDVHIYPIPARTLIHVYQYQIGQYRSYELSNESGQVITIGTLRESQDQDIELPLLPTGLYYLKLKGRSGTYAAKVLVQQ